jgi:hypothetical protein
VKATNTMPKLGVPLGWAEVALSIPRPPVRTPEPHVSKRAKANAKAKAKHKRGGSLGHPEKKP